MKVQWTGIADEVRGHVDQSHYARRLPGNGEWAAVCQKPELSKATCFEDGVQFILLYRCLCILTHRETLTR